MKTEFVKKEGNKVEFTMAFTAEEFDAATQKSYLANRGKFAIDGFRKGKAPRSIIEKWYGTGIFFDDAIDSLLNDNYTASLDELKIEPVSRPEVDFKEERIESGKGFTAILKVEVAPEVELKEYKGIKADRYTRPVKDSDVDAAMESMRSRNGRMVSVERAAENGDTVVLDYKGFVGDNQFKGGTAENQTLKLGSGTFIPGFEDQLVGVKAGEAKDVHVTFPAEYHAEELAGKEAVFQCLVHEVKFEELPELNDDFAKDVSEFDTLAELKEDQKKQLVEKAKEEAERYAKNEIIKALCEANKFDVPNAMVEDEMDNVMARFEDQLAYSGMKLADYCKYLQKKPEEVREEFRSEALQSVQIKLIVAAVAKAEKIEASEEDLAKELEKLAAEYKMEAAKIKESLEADGSMKYLKQDIVTRKALQFVYDNASFNEIEDLPGKMEATYVK